MISYLTVNKALSATQVFTFTSDSEGIDVPLFCIWDALCATFKLSLEFLCYEVKCMLESHCYERRPLFEQQSGMPNSNAFDALEWRKPVLGIVMEALAVLNTYLIGVHVFHDEIKHTLLERVSIRVQRDQLFGMAVTANVTERPNVRKIQEDIACQLGFILIKCQDKRAKEFIHRIKNEQNILIVLRDLHKELDLSKVGIPYGAYHMGCKILLTSTTEHVLSDHMHTEKNFMD